jgi:hypothetical protein
MHIERQLHRGPEEAPKDEVKQEGLEDVNPAPKTAPEDRYKLIFYTPQSDLEAIKSAMFAVGAGTYPGGKYTQCCFESIGTNQFHPVAERGANPTIGTKEGEGYRVERVLEVRCEILCVGREVLKEAVKALRRFVAFSEGGVDANWNSAHPYEEPAYEAYRMEDV